MSHNMRQMKHKLNHIRNQLELLKDDSVTSVEMEIEIEMEGWHGDYSTSSDRTYDGDDDRTSAPKPDPAENEKEITKRLDELMSTTEIEDAGRGIVTIKTPDNPDALMRSTLTDDDRQQVAKLREVIDSSDITGVMGFGTAAQQRIGGLSDRLLAGVKSRDLTLVKDDLNVLVKTAEGYDVEDDRNWFERWVIRKPVDTLKTFVDSFADVETQIDTVSGKLMEHRANLLQSSENLNDLYITTLNLYKELHLHIVALEEEIEAKQQEIDAIADEIKDNPEDRGLPHMMEAMARQRDAMERQKEALHQTQTLAAQDMPTLVNMKDVDLQLMNKIQQAINHMIPLWKKKLAMIVQASKTQDAISVMDVVSGFTDTLITEGATKIRDMTKQGREHVEKALTSEEALKKVNEVIIDMTKETIEATEQHRIRRITAAENMNKMQGDLAQTLVEARNKALRGEMLTSQKRAALSDMRSKDEAVQTEFTGRNIPSGEGSEQKPETRERNYSMTGKDAA